MSLQADYLALSKGARMHLKCRAGDRFYFRTSGQVKWFIWGVIGLICLLSSLLMSVVLDGAEQIIYMVTSFCLIIAVMISLGMRRHLVLDITNGKLLREKSWWGLRRSVKSADTLTNQRAVVAPIAELSQGCLLEIADQKYTIGTFDQTRQLAIFINRHFAVPAFDRVTQWPNEIELHDKQQADTVSCASPAPQQPLSSAGLEEHKSQSVVSTQVRYVPIGDQKVFLKLALPFPLFLLLGILLSQLANRGGV